MNRNKPVVAHVDFYYVNRGITTLPGCGQIDALTSVDNSTSYPQFAQQVIFATPQSLPVPTVITIDFWILFF